MQIQFDMVAEFHRAMGAPVNTQLTNLDPERAAFRHSLIAEEVQEYLDAAQNGSIPEIAKELSDILYAVYGAILEHGLQDHMPDVFAEVHASNMSKDYSAGRKGIKGDGYRKADLTSIFSV